MRKLFNFIHSNDMHKVCEELTSNQHNNRENSTSTKEKQKTHRQYNNHMKLDLKTFSPTPTPSPATAVNYESVLTMNCVRSINVG